MSEVMSQDPSKLVPKGLGAEVVKRLELRMPQVIADLDAMHEQAFQKRKALEAEWDARKSKTL